MTPFIGQGEQEETQVWIMGGGDHIYIYTYLYKPIHICEDTPQQGFLSLHPRSLLAAVSEDCGLELIDTKICLGLLRAFGFVIVFLARYHSCVL